MISLVIYTPNDHNIIQIISGINLINIHIDIQKYKYIFFVFIFSQVGQESIIEV